MAMAGDDAMELPFPAPRRHLRGWPMRRTAGIFCILALGYAATPYLALWQVCRAMEQGDSETLSRMVDWDSVRSGLKEDISEGIVGLPSGQNTDSAVLPPFGSGFVSGIASNVIDTQVTPQHLADAVHGAQAIMALPEAPQAPVAPAHGGLSIGSLTHAFFETPTSFIVGIHMPGQDSEDAPLRVRLEWHGMGWKVVRAWIPQDLMDATDIHT